MPSEWKRYRMVTPVVEARLWHPGDGNRLALIHDGVVCGKAEPKEGDLMVRSAEGDATGQRWLWRKELFEEIFEEAPNE